MTDINAKALALVNALGSAGIQTTNLNRNDIFHEALYRAIEQHEAFKQKVSDAVANWKDMSDFSSFGTMLKLAEQDLFGFIIPAPEPDPLVAVLGDLEWHNSLPECAAILRALLEARGLEIRSKNDD